MIFPVVFIFVKKWGHIIQTSFSFFFRRKKKQCSNWEKSFGFRITYIIITNKHSIDWSKQTYSVWGKMKRSHGFMLSKYNITLPLSINKRIHLGTHKIMDKFVCCSNQTIRWFISYKTNLPMASVQSQSFTYYIRFVFQILRLFSLIYLLFGYFLLLLLDTL